jgi:HD superfamily phosphohydrolase
MNNEKLFRDPVHNLIILDRSLPEDRLLLAAIDTVEVQRLRRIKQLGMAHVAYQGAEHSRFSHSIGVLHLVRRLLERLVRDYPVEPRLQLATMLAALLHDIGHGPFSHVMEKFFREDHEAWTERLLLDPATGIHRVLADHDPELPALVCSVISGEMRPRWLSLIVSSQLDADRFDYLLRDAHMTGTKYGIFDLERLVLLLRVTPDGEKIYVASKGVLPVEKYLQSRYQMYRQVYFHKTVTAAESMLMGLLERAAELAANGGAPAVAPGTPLAKLLTREPLSTREFLSLDDSVLYGAMNLWQDAGDPILADLSHRLLNRRLFKTLEMSTNEEEDLIFGQRLTAAREFLAAQGLDWRYYLRLSKSSDTPYRPYSPRGGKSSIWIQTGDEPFALADVAEVSPTIRAFTESPYTLHRAFFPDTANGKSIRRELTALLTG